MGKIVEHNVSDTGAKLRQYFFLGLVLFVGLFLLQLVAYAVEFQNIADTRPQGFITDQAAILGDTAALETSITQLEKETSAEIAVVTIDSLPANHTIETFATELFEAWGIGKAQNDNGLLLLIARDDRQFRVEVGYGLEGTIPDLLAARITEAYLVPRFREGNYQAGVTDTLGALSEVIKGNVEEVIAERPEVSPQQGIGLPFLLFSLFFLVGGLPMIFKAILFFIALVVAYAIAGVFGIVLYLIALAIAAIIYANKDNFPTGGGLGGGHWGGGGGSFGGGGFGGFGGGISGGGGFSGRW